MQGKKEKKERPRQMKTHRSMELEKGFISGDLIELIKKPLKPKKNLRKVLKANASASE